MSETTKISQTIKFDDREPLFIETTVTGGTVLSVETAVELGVISKEQANILRGETGQGLLEFALIFGLVVLLIAGAVVFLGGNLQELAVLLEVLQ